MVLFLIKVLIFIQFSVYFDISQDVNNKVRKLIHNKESFSKLKKFTKKCANNHQKLLFLLFVIIKNHEFKSRNIEFRIDLSQ